MVQGQLWHLVPVKPLQLLKISGRKRKKKKRCHQYPAPTCCPPSACVYDWVQGLGGAPDEPHAANVSDLKTEGSGVGVSKEPPVNVKANNGHFNAGKFNPDDEGITTALASEAQGASSLCFKVTLTERVEVTWETLLVGNRLFVEIPTGILPAGSKESFVTLLEYAEEVLNCSFVIVCFKKGRTDRACLIRTFMFLGFTMVAPGNRLVPSSGDLLYMAYSIDGCGSDSPSDDSDDDDDESE